MRKGYVIALSDSGGNYIKNALHIERDDELFLYPDDRAAAEAAEQDGIKLLHGIPLVEDGIYLDTPENRFAIYRSLREGV